MENQDDSSSSALLGIVLGETIKAAKDSPELKTAGSKLASSALIVSTTINNALLPLAAVNFGIQKAREYFEQRFEREMAEKLNRIPVDQITEPKPYVVGPALSALAYVHDEPSLKEMFLNLLASSMNKSACEQAHPSFVEIIKQIDPFEAEILSLLFEINQHPIFELRLRSEGGGFRVLLQHLTNLMDTKASFETLNRVRRAVENFERLGLWRADYESYLTREDAYDWADHHNFVKDLQKVLESRPDTSLEFKKGMLNITALGTSFKQTVFELSE